MVVWQAEEICLTISHPKDEHMPVFMSKTIPIPEPPTFVPIYETWLANLWTNLSRQGAQTVSAVTFQTYNSRLHVFQSNSFITFQAGGQIPNQIFLKGSSHNKSTELSPTKTDRYCAKSGK